MRRGPTRGWLLRLLRLPVREKVTTLHALAALVVVELLIRRVRLPRLAALAGVSLEAGGAAPGQAGQRPPPRPPAPASDQVARAVRSTRRVLRPWPFGDGPCLRESLVLGHLLRQRSPLLRIGVANRAGGLRAHAWLEVDGLAVGEREGFAAFGAASGSGR